MNKITYWRCLVYQLFLNLTSHSEQLSYKMETGVSFDFSDLEIIKTSELKKETFFV